MARRSCRIVGNFIFVLSFVVLSAGCATVKPSANQTPVLLSKEPDFDSIPSFQRLILTTPGTEEYERARIEYLLARIKTSSFQFVRNDSEYSNGRAMMHLRWKYLKNQDEVHTAEDFVNRVAKGSKQTGRDYLLRVSIAQLYPLYLVLHQELKMLSQGLQLEKQKRLSEKVKVTDPNKLVGSDLQKRQPISLEAQTIKKTNQSAEVLSHNKQLI